MMRWGAPPERREIAIVVLSLFTYFIAYNFETLGIDPVATQGAVLRRIGLGGKTRVIGADGRKPLGWRDNLEEDIFGDWAWDEGHVVGHFRERSQPTVAGRHGASWLWGQNQNVIQEDDRPFHESTVDKGLLSWGDDVPLTRVVKHVPGYTILDNVVVYNGSLYVITDSPSSLPSMDTVVVTAGNAFSEVKVLHADNAAKTIGTHGALIRGVSWLAADDSPHNSTLFAMWRAYSSLDPLITSEGHTKLAPPHRLLFPHSRFFTDANPPFDDYMIRRRRVDTGFHPYTAKAAFPQLSLEYYEDWDDTQKFSVAFLYERLLLVDRQAAQRSMRNGLPAFAAAFALDASPSWWEPIRRNMALFLEEYDISSRAKPVVTYLHSQSEPTGLKLSTVDHDALVSALQSMCSSYGYELHVVSSQTSDTTWKDRMTAIVRSEVVIGVHGSHMMDSVYMRPTSRSTMMEFFPTGRYTRDQEVALQSVGIKYRAWWGSDSKIESFPPVHPPHSEHVAIDIPAISRAIRDAFNS